MVAERWERVKSVFSGAAELPPDSRAAFLDSACDGDPGLRAQVESMLRVEEEASGFLEGPIREMLEEPGTDGGGAGEYDLPPGTRVGCFVVESLIARGGMGAVYRARQENPERAVALKILHSASRGALRRFELESHALARLQHPCIAQIIEAGRFHLDREGGRVSIPYFAMELVEGEPITRGAAGLGVPARLELLAQVCDAVEHAHQRGVIHRDLKPSNILVDRAGRARVLDFGVARLTGPDVRATLATDARSVVGTIAYMSPEQVAGNPAGVDTRSDVYSLGVLASEVLTGRVPYERVPSTILEAVALIREHEPVRPSRRNPALRGDLDAVVLSALEKDPEHRYQSPGALGADLRRVARREPVSVRPPTAVYMLRSFARRHKPLVAAVAAGVLALAAGAVVATREAVRAMRAEREAREHLLQLERTATALLDEVYETVFALPGAEQARRQLAQQAVALLDELGSSAPDDIAIQTKLAQGWMKLAFTMGAPGNSNLNNRSGTLECFDKAIAIMERVRALNPKAREPADMLAVCWLDRAISARTLADRLHDMNMAVALAEGLWSTMGDRPAGERSPIVRRLAHVLSVRAVYDPDPLRRAGDGRRAVAILRALGESRPLTTAEGKDLAMACRCLADAVAETSPQESAQAARDVFAILEPMAGDPDAEFLRRTHGGAAAVLLGRLSAADGWNEADVERARRAVDTLESLLATDPTNDYLQRCLAEPMPNYVRMWIVLAEHPGVDAEHRRQAVIAGAAAAERGLELWAALRDHDQLGPGDDVLEAELRGAQAELADLLRVMSSPTDAAEACRGGSPAGGGGRGAAAT